MPDPFEAAELYAEWLSSGRVEDYPTWLARYRPGCGAPESYEAYWHCDREERIHSANGG